MESDEDSDMEVLECAEDAEMDEDEDDDEAGPGRRQPQQVWIPGKGGEQPEHLEVDNSTYEMLHRMNVEWPMLSFDFVADNLGPQRTKFPLTAYAAGGTQADDRGKNKIILMKMHQLHRTKHDDGSGSDSDNSQDGDDDLDDDPELQHVSVAHSGAVNRLRVMPQQPGIMASWSDAGKVHVWDLNAPLHGLAGTVAPATTHACEPIFTNDKHKDEGYAVDWSRIVPGQLATGDCKHAILRCKHAEGGFAVDGGAYRGHTASVEDIQWSPTEAEVMASCSVDQTIKIWDARKRDGAAISVKAATNDVNVITWNAKVPYLLASGDEDGHFRVWDLRNFKSGQPVADFAWHSQAITSIEWCPDQPSVIAASARDNQVTLWDMSLERDAEAEAEMVAEGIPVPEIPAQLLFIHQGQQDIKEIHWHPQVRDSPGDCTC